MQEHHTNNNHKIQTTTHHDSTGHSSATGHADHVSQFRRLFWLMLVLAVPVVGFNDMFAHLVGYSLPPGTWVLWVSPVLGTALYLWGGRPFLQGALEEIRHANRG